MKLLTPLALLIVLLLGCDRQPEPGSDTIGASQGIDRAGDDSTKYKFIADLDELEERILSTHPRPFDFISESDFEKLVATHRASITKETNERQFLWMFSSIAASVGCSHTNLGYFNQEDRLVGDGERFPLQAVFLGDRLYVTDPLTNADELKPGDEITAINGIAVTELQEGIYSHISTDGHIVGQKQAIANAYVTSYLTYELGFPDQYSVVVRGQDSAAALRQLDSFTPPPRIAVSDPCQETLCGSITEDQDLAVLKIRDFAFYGDKFGEYKAFIDENMTQIMSKKVNNLIIDVRGNQGGPSAAALYLLRHFADKPFTYFSSSSQLADDDMKVPTPPLPNVFRGRVVVVTDGATASTTGHFLSLVKFHGFAEIVGEESGSTYTVNDASERYKSTNLGISYKIPTATFTTEVSGLPRDKGILPDHPVTSSIDAILADKDELLGAARDLVGSR